MARKPCLSPSKLTTYLACPLKYMWTYIDPKGKWYLRSKSTYSFGSTLHAVLQRFHDEDDRGVTTVSEAIGAMEESWIDAGYASAQEMQEAMGEGKAILESYIERFGKSQRQARTIMLERQLRMSLGEFDLLGRIDRVDEHEDGTLEIIDYKSKRTEVTPQEVQTDLAMACYQLLLRDRFPGRHVVATIVAVRTGAEACASLTDEEAEIFREDVTQLGRKIFSRKWESVVPTYKTLCTSCDFRPLCSRHPEWKVF